METVINLRGSVDEDTKKIRRLSFREAPLIIPTTNPNPLSSTDNDNSVTSEVIPIHPSTSVPSSPTSRRKLTKAPTNLLKEVLSEQPVNATITSFEFVRSLKPKEGERFGPVMAMLVVEKKRLVYCGTWDRRITAWSIQSGEIMGTFVGHWGYITSLAIGPLENDILFSGSSDSTVRAWNTNSFECVKVFRGHQSHVQFIRLLPNSSPIILLSASTDGTIRIWNTVTAYCLRVLIMNDTITSFDLYTINNNNFIVAASREMKVWSIGEQYSVSQIFSFTGHQDFVWCMKPYTVNGQVCGVLTASWDKTIRFWDLFAGKCTHIFTGHTNHVYCLCLNSDNGADTLFSGSADTTAISWDIKSGKMKKF